MTENKITIKDEIEVIRLNFYEKTKHIRNDEINAFNRK
jgi:hypothetical protein